MAENRNNKTKYYYITVSDAQRIVCIPRGIAIGYYIEISSVVCVCVCVCVKLA